MSVLPPRPAPIWMEREYVRPTAIPWLIDPWGHVIAKASDGVGIVSTRIDRALVKKIRAQIPVAQHKVAFD